MAAKGNVYFRRRRSPLTLGQQGDALQTQSFLEAEENIHILHRLSRRAFDQIINYGQDHNDVSLTGAMHGDAAQIAALVANHLRFKDVPQMKPATLKRFVRLDRFEEHMELHRLDCLSSHRNLENYEYVRRFLAETPPEQVRPPRLLTGDDLLELGFRPGPAFKEILFAVEEAQLNGDLRTSQEAREYVKAKYLRDATA